MSEMPPSPPDHPRIRGEHLFSPPCGRGATGSSPHTRGALGSGSATARIAGIIPAYAGSTLLTVSCRSAREGSSPHTRGARGSLTAYRGRRRDHPRIRGEHTIDDRRRILTNGSSPHTRGARPRPVGRRRRARIIPAYAGSTPTHWWPPPERSDHPRIRGEHLVEVFSAEGGDGSSPHTRGAPGIRTPQERSARIIPAYAGSTAHYSR